MSVQYPAKPILITLQFKLCIGKSQDSKPSIETVNTTKIDNITPSSLSSTPYLFQITNTKSEIHVT